MKRTVLPGALAALVTSTFPVLAEDIASAPQPPDLSALAAAIGATQVTFRSHSLPPGGSIGNAEGNACPANTDMLSGACHPGYSDQVSIINQYPNVGARTWRCGFQNTSGTTRTAWVYTLCSASAPRTTPPLTHNLSVSRYTTATLNNTDADRIMADASTVAQTADFAGDVACNIAMTRSGNVTTFSTGDGSIDSQAEFNAVMGAPGWISVVNQINWCGSIGAGIIGCAPVPGSSLAVVRFTTTLEGILWLHEFGHNKGLSHRNGTSNVMHPSIGASRLGLNTAECTAFNAPTPAVAEASVVMAAGAGDGGATDGNAPSVETPPDVGDFVRQHFFHGVPYDVARNYSPDDVPALLDMLADPAEQEWKTNIVAVLGMIGTEETVFEPLVAFLESPGEDLPPEIYRAKATVPLALGYLANQSGSEKAVDYLIAAANPDFWAERSVGRATFQAATSERDADLATKAILGLALSGTERAFEALQVMEKEGLPSVAGSRDVIVEALSANRQISAEGLSEYYDGQEPQPQ